MKLTLRVGLHLALLTFAAATAILSRVLLRDAHARELRQIGERARAEQSSEVEAAWRSLRYTSSEPPRFEESFLNKIDFAGLGLAGIQEAKLREQLVRLLRYLESPTVEHYLTLKTQGLRFEFKASRATEALLARDGMSAEEVGLMSAEESVSHLWRAVSSGEAGSGPRRLTTVCLDNIAVSIGRTNSPLALLKGPTRKGFTTAIEAIDPGFAYPALARPRPDGTGPPVVCLSFYARVSGSENAGPVYIALTWCAGAEQWAPVRFISDSWLKWRILF